VVIELGRDSTGKRRQRWLGGFPTRRDAEAARARAVSEINTSTYVEPSRLTLTEWTRDHWLPRQRGRVKPSTFDSYRRNLEIHVLPRIGSTRLQSLQPSALEQLYGDLMTSGRCDGSGGLSARTVSYIHRIVHNTLSDALDAGIVRVNAAARARPPRPHAANAPRHAWTAGELARFLAVAEQSPLGAAWRLAAMTGMRRGEILGLRWHDVDLANARVAVRQARVAVGYEVVTSSPKTRRVRTVDLDQGTVAALQRHRDRPVGAMVDQGVRAADRDLVFRRLDGAPMHPHSLSKAFDRLVAQAGLPRIRLHDLRHTHASIALAAGVPVKVVSERLGHASPAFTLSQYAHTLPGMQREAAELVAGLVEATRNATNGL
jgi:integrase